MFTEDVLFNCVCMEFICPFLYICSFLDKVSEIRHPEYMPNEQVWCNVRILLHVCIVLNVGYGTSSDLYSLSKTDFMNFSHNRVLLT